MQSKEPSPSPNLSDLWNHVDATLGAACDAHNAGKLVPLVEADISGYLYHLLVTRFDGDSRSVHLDTRLPRFMGAKTEKEKYDLVIGPVVTTGDQVQILLERRGEKLNEAMKQQLKSRSALPLLRPAIVPKLVLELKIFPIGFTPGQLRNRFTGAIEDIRKLGTLRQICPEGRAVVLFDDEGYLTPDRQQDILGARSAEDPYLRIYLFQRNNDGQMRWRHL